MLTPLRSLLALALLVAAVPLPAQQNASSAPPPPADSLSRDGYAAGARAAQQRGAAGWFWGGFVAGVPAGPGVLSFLLGGDGSGLVPYTIGGLGASVGITAAAARSHVTLSPEQNALLTGSDSLYAASYRRAFTDSVRRRRTGRAAVGSVAGVTAGAAALYALVCLAFCGEFT
jgi:hypothetical protein